MDTTREFFLWQGRAIEVLFTPSYSESYRPIYGYALAHLQISADGRAPLPISETGYRSRFERADNIDAVGGAATMRAHGSIARSDPLHGLGPRSRPGSYRCSEKTRPYGPTYFEVNDVA